MKSIGVILNREKPGAVELLPQLREQAEQTGLELWFDADCAEYLPNNRCLEDGDLFSRVEAVITLGGDGTLLNAIRRMGETPLPLLGVNFGKLGFLTSITQTQLAEALSGLSSGDLVASQRPLLDCRFENPDGTSGSARALNDLVLSWGKSSHIATLNVSINGKPLTTYTCDGLILSTPTGSTGHSLSAGGPILNPDTRNLVICPICPHAMTVRPLVLTEQCTVEIELTSHSKNLVLACDGQSMADLHPGARVRASVGSVAVKLLQLPDYNYWEVLREKLHWRGSAVE